MKLIPYQKFTIDAPYTNNEVKQKLEKITSASAKSNKQSNKLFNGEINEGNFKISRILFYRNSFNPVIRGKFMADDDSTKVLVGMALPKLVVVFLIIWCTMDLAIMLFAIANTVIAGEFDTFFLFGLLSLVFAYGFALVGFNREADAAKEALILSLK